MATDKEVVFKLKVEADGLRKQLKQAEDTVQNLKKSLEGLDKRRTSTKALISALNKEEAKLLNTRTKLKTTTDNLAFAQKNTSIALDGTSKATGAATSSVLELGRVVQDSNYGMRGMANNLTQLASQMVFTVKSAGGLIGGLKQIGQAMLGPAGLLLAISYVVSKLEEMEMTQDSANDSLYKGEKAAAAAASNLKILQETLEKGLLTQEEANRAVNKANQEYDGLNLKLDENNQLTDDSVLAINRKIIALEKLAKAQAIQSLVEEQYSLLAAKRAELDAELAERGTTLAKVEEKNKQLEIDLEEKTVASKRQLRRDYFTQEEKMSRRSVKNFRETEEEINKTLSNLMKQLGEEDLVDELFKEDKKGGRGRVARFFKERLMDFTKEIMSFNKNREQIEEKNQQKLLDIRQKYEQEDLLRKKQQFIEREEKRLKEYKKDVAGRKNASKLIAEAEEIFRNEKADAEQKYRTAKSALDRKQAAEDFEFQRKLVADYNESLLQSIAKREKARAGMLGTNVSAGALNRPMSSVGAEGSDIKASQQQSSLEADKKLKEEELQRKVEKMVNEGKSLFQAEQLIQGEREQFLKETADREIEIETMKIEAKKNINQEYISWAGGIGTILRGIAGENEEIAKMALVLEKGAKIASIVIETQAANAKIGAIAAVQAQNPVTAPLAALAPARIMKNNIGAGISIAAILATSLNSSKKPSGGGGRGAGGGGGGRSFDFNLVGSTRQDQLAQSIGGKFDEPVRAYVVGSDITTRQQLDNKIKTTATI